ncbi:ComEC/Rec2 family competence protein [Isoptericola hypogeus]
MATAAAPVPVGARPGADLRLVPALLATLGVAWLVTGPAGEASPVVVAAGTGALAVLGVVRTVLRGRASERRGLRGLRGHRGRLARVAGPADVDRAGANRAGANRAGVNRAGVNRAGGTATHVALVIACVVAVCAGAAVQTAQQEPLSGAADEGALARLSGRVASEPRPAVFGEGERWVLAVRAVSARGVTTRTAGQVEVTAPGPPPRFGAAVDVTGVLQATPPGDGVLARATAAAPVPEREPPGAVLRATHTLRAALLDVTEPLSPQARGLVPGVAVGDTSRLPAELADAMRTTSLTHVTAVSGGHFAIVVATLTALCAAFRLPRAVRIAAVALVSLGFVALVRPEPSVLRAAWTCAVALLGLALGRRSAGFPALAAAATALLVVDPWLARSYGFVLSCAATAGLVLLAGPLARRLAPWTGRPLAFALAVPWAAQAACGPVLVLLDPRVALVSVPANLLAGPALVPATVLGLVATVLAPWAPGLAQAVAWLAGLATAWIAAVAGWFADLPGAGLPWPGGPGGAIALGLVTAAGLAVVLRRPPGDGWPRSWRDTGTRAARRARASVRRRAGSRHRGRTTRAHSLLVGLGAGALALVVAVLVSRWAGLPGAGGGAVPRDWEVVACDVGQGDALVVRSGPASAVVVDVGPAGDLAGRCLERLGVDRVDLLVLSHFHADHVGGLDTVLEGRAVTAALVSPLDEPVDQAARARAALAAAGVPVRTAARGDAGVAGGASWQVLGADAGGAGGGSAEGDGANDASVALHLRTAGGLDVVALGDLEEPGQEALLGALGASGDATDVDVVKMAHHGSRSQSAGLAARLSPRVTLVSVGADNTYGHPTDAAVDLYEGTGSALVRTDECGTAALVVRSGEIGLACS